MRIGSPQWRRMLRTGAEKMGIPLEAEAVERLAAHAELVCLWGEKANLTAIRDPIDVVSKHYLDCLAANPWIPPQGSMLDVGSGAGFPGIPLKVLNPSILLTLVDASRKKVNFLKHVVRTLALDKTDVVQSRVEDMPPGRRFDVITSRALGALGDFIRLTEPMLKTGGIWIAFKAKEAAAEVEAVRGQGVRQRAGGYRPCIPGVRFEIHPYRLAGVQAERALIIVRNGLPASDAEDPEGACHGK